MLVSNSRESPSGLSSDLIETAARNVGHGLLERERELAELAQALDRAVAGKGGVVVVEGAAGIGKSALLRAAVEAAHARGIRPLSARGSEVERDVPFGATRQLLEPALREIDAGGHTRLFSGAVSPARRLFDPGADSDRGDRTDPEFATLHALYWLLAGLADAEPIALVVDDAHWADPPSLRLLDFLGPRIGELGAVAIVGTRPAVEKPGDGVLGRLLADPATRVLRPGTLSAAAVRGLVTERLGEHPDPAFVDACTEVTGGNPFFLGELLRELERGGVRGTTAEVARVHEVGPRGVSLSLRHRGAATVAGAALARALSVLGETGDFRLLAALAGLDPSDAARAADALVRDSLLAPGPTLAFAHPIVRTAVYSEMGPRQRADLHARAARLLRNAGAPNERVVAQHIRTDPRDDPEVVADLSRAAAEALGQGAPQSAVDYLRRALAEPPDASTRPQLLMELARAAWMAGHPDAPDRFADAYAAAVGACGRAAVAERGALCLFAAGRAAEAFGMLAASADELQREFPDQALALESELIGLSMYEPAAAAHFMPRLDAVDGNISAASRGSRKMLCQLAYRRMWRSQDAARAADLAERALAGEQLIAERGLDLNAVALTLICADRLDAASRLLDIAEAHARTSGSRFDFALVSFLRGELAFRRGSLANVEAQMRVALGVTTAAGDLVGAAVATGLLITTLLELDQHARAGDALDAFNSPLEALPPQPQFIFLLSARGRLRLRRGDLAGGLSDLHECGRRYELIDARNPVFVPWRVDAALVHRAHGELDAAWVLAREELAAARDWGTPGAIGAAQRLIGLLSSGEEAIVLLREAASMLAESPARLEHARALVDLGAALRRTNRRADAREPLTRGLDLADRCGARVLSQRARDELRAMGARPRRARLSGLEALTASERRVAELAASGLSNTEIAQNLFVTRKTIEKHLGNAYIKLGVKSRAELPARFG